MRNVLPHILEKDKFYEKSVFLPVQDLFWARDYLLTVKYIVGSLSAQVVVLGCMVYIS